MHDHGKFKGQVVTDRFFKIGIRRDFIVEIIEAVEPFIFGSDSRRDAEFRRRLYLPTPYIQKMLPFILRRISFHEADVCAYFITIVAEVDKFTELGRVVRFVRGENGNHRIHTHAVKGICVACYHPPNV